MACCGCYLVNFMAISSIPNKPLTLSTLLTSKLSSSYSQIPFSSLSFNSKLFRIQLHKSKTAPNSFVVMSGIKAEPLKVMISGSHASGKGTQCELITKKSKSIFMTLFAGTIAENIGYMDLMTAIDMRKVELAAQTANADEFIKNLPGQYETNVGPSGSNFSGGQKQRLAIARVLYQNPSILILDEATSALGSMSELLVRQALQHLMHNRHRALGATFTFVNKCEYIVWPGILANASSPSLDSTGFELSQDTS